MARVAEVQSRERLAWIIVISGFVLFLGILIAIPVGINAALRNATMPLAVFIEAAQGTASVNNERAISPEVGIQLVDEGDRIRTDFPTTAVLTLFPDENQTDQQIGRVQVSQNGIIDMVSVRRPRFRFSERGYEMDMGMGNGRYLINLNQVASWQLSTPHSKINIQDVGQYQLSITPNGTQLHVQSGQALLTAFDGTSTLITTSQRVIITDQQQLEGPFTPTIDLVEDGSFRQSLQGKSRWTLSNWAVELPEQPTGEVRQITTSDRTYLQIEREGVGHADIHLAQTIKYEMPPFQAEQLRLQITFRILEHSLDVCGFQGSECPLFLQLSYTNETGAVRTWQQGFYGVSVTGSTSPYACFSCDVVQTAHERVLLNETVTYSISMAEIAAIDTLPHTLEDIQLVASGHGFAVEILDVSLVLEEG